MSMHEGNRGRFEAFENVRKNDALAKRERVDAEAVRTRLERGAPIGERASLGRIVAMATVDAVANRSLENTLGGLRKMAQASRVRDAGGSLTSNDPRADDHWSSGEVMSIEQMRSLKRSLQADSSRAIHGEPMTDQDYNDLAAYTMAPEKTILTAADALRDGSAEYARRVLYLYEAKILASMAEIEAELRVLH